MTNFTCQSLTLTLSHHTQPFTNTANHHYNMSDEILDYEDEFVFSEEYSQALDASVHEEGSVTSVADPSLIGSQEVASGGMIAPILVLSPIYLPSYFHPIPYPPLPSLTTHTPIILTSTTTPYLASIDVNQIVLIESKGTIILTLLPIMEYSASESDLQDNIVEFDSQPTNTFLLSFERLL